MDITYEIHTVNMFIWEWRECMYVIIIILVAARGFPRCKPNRIPDKMLENIMSENRKPDKIPDYLTRTLTLTSP